jgi:AcrR family transcriptional regulator
MAADERREAIIDATLPLLTAHGGGVTTRQIAEAAGIAEGTIFRVFADKRELLIAAAERTMNPPQGREQMAAALSELSDLRSKVVVVAERLIARMEQGMLVMMALRSAFMSEGPPAQALRDHPKHDPGGPPAFIVEANQQLLANLTDLLFAPHADDLRVTPQRAALVLRSLVFGAWHPGLPRGTRELTPEDVADVVLDGVAARHPSDRLGKDS